jgi:hypothetical protein
MAKMFPGTFPNDPSNPKRCRAERKFFDACSEQLTNDWLVFHSQHYVGKRKSLGQRNGLGEADFILAHREFGLLFVEVKGGGIDIEDGVWHSRDNDGRRPIADPFVQAQEASQAIFETLKTELPDLSFSNCVRHGVAFPDVSQNAGTISTHAKREMIIFREDLARISSRVAEIVSFYGQRPKWSDVDFRKIQSVLRPTKRTPGISYTEYVGILDQLDALTESQKKTIRQLTKHSGKTVVMGGAGTGKTVLGMWRAESLAREGRKVLYLCANRSLANHLAAEVRKVENSLAENLTIDTASAFISSIERAGTRGDGFRERMKAIPEKIDRFLDGIERSDRDETIDCLVVDEAQDILKTELELVEMLLRKPSDGGSELILGDPNQQLLIKRKESALDLSGSENLCFLDVNCRNTYEIADLAHGFTDEAVETLETVSGIEVRVKNIREDLAVQLAAEVHALREKYDPKSLVVLTLNGFSDLGPSGDMFVDGLRQESRANLSATDLSHQVSVFSARTFQGREADAVIIAPTEQSLLRTFPFRQFYAEVKKNRRLVTRQQTVDDLTRVSRQFERYRQDGLPRRVETFKRDLEQSGDDLTESRKKYLIEEFERACEREFEPRFKDPFLNEEWEKRQTESLKVALYSMMTRARVILSIVAEKQVNKAIKRRLRSQGHDIDEIFDES